MAFLPAYMREGRCGKTTVPKCAMVGKEIEKSPKESGQTLFVLHQQNQPRIPNHTKISSSHPSECCNFQSLPDFQDIHSPVLFERM